MRREENLRKNFRKFDYGVFVGVPYRQLKPNVWVERISLVATSPRSDEDLGDEPAGPQVVEERDGVDQFGQSDCAVGATWCTRPANPRRGRSAP